MLAEVRIFGRELRSSLGPTRRFGLLRFDR
jgi:hypothetical protein